MKKILFAFIILLVAAIASFYLYLSLSNKQNTIIDNSDIKPAEKNNTIENNTLKQKYTIPYKAEGSFENLYKNLAEVSNTDNKITDLISFAKNIAKEAGYPITGGNLDKFKLNDIEYSMEIKIYENSEYYIVLFLPTGTPTTSNDLKIGIQKDTNKIISILKGS